MDLPSIAVEACWRPMLDDVAGDLHEVVDLRDGRVAILVGKAARVGREAARLAEEIRGWARRAFAVTSDPAAVLTELDSIMSELRRQPTASLIVAVLDPSARVIRLANAGHMPAIFVEGITVELFDGVIGPALGTPGTFRREALRELRTETSMFFFTEGLIERPGVRRQDAIASVVDASHGIGGASAWASEFARRATEQFGQPTTDATVVSVRLAVQAPPTADAPPKPTGERVVLRVYVDPRDLRTPGLLDVLAQLGGMVRGVSLGLEIIDVTSKSAMTEEAGVLAAPTILRARPEPAVRVIGWFDSPVPLARALQLPVAARS